VKWPLARARFVAGLLATFALGFVREARADDSVKAATFALIMGSNLSVDPDLPPLKYADDDAASYLDLFRVLGARTYLLSRLDDNTRRLHAQAAAEALEPRRAAFEQAVAQITADVTRARDRQVETVLYIVYAGHGNVRDGEGYVTLEDMRITGAYLARIVAGIPATRVHVIVDACASYYLAYSRGPGGERRPLSGFEDSAQLASDPRVGLLLSTSSARESHEWDGFQAGVFSHEVRSGLYGGADADGDGRVSYREIAAFISQANGAIPNERFRPRVLARPPRESDTLLDLHHGLERRLDIDGAHAAHYWLEDSRGVRLLDVHNGNGQTVHIVRPSPDGPIYVRRASDDTEFVLPVSPDVVSLADLEGGTARVAVRGAAHEAFSLLFSLPFDRGVVATYVEPSAPDAAPPAPGILQLDQASRDPSAGRVRRALGWGGVGLGATGVGVGVALSISAATVAGGSSRQESEADVAHRNTRISTLDTGAAVGFVVGGLSLATGAALLLWPDSHHFQAGLLPSGGYVGYGSVF
jgi:Caspase domain